MECSCKLWPMPGMYVVTSTEFVNRTRATLRSAEFGFFGVCVYTRMHTPRFSGQPINAGDFVLTWTFSRPMRTNCENVGTVFLFYATARRSTPSRAEISVPGHRKIATRRRGSRRRAHKTARERTARLKGLLRIRRKTPSKKLRTHSRRQKSASGFDSERLTRLCGAGAPFRPLFCPIPSYFVPGPKIFLPTTQGKKLPDKQRSIRKTPESVKSVRHSDAKNPVENELLAWALPAKPSPHTNLL